MLIVVAYDEDTLRLIFERAAKLLNCNFGPRVIWSTHFIWLALPKAPAAIDHGEVHNRAVLVAATGFRAVWKAGLVDIKPRVEGLDRISTSTDFTARGSFALRSISRSPGLHMRAATVSAHSIGALCLDAAAA